MLILGLPTSGEDLLEGSNFNTKHLARLIVLPESSIL